MSRSDDDFAPSADWKMLACRARLLQQVRQFFIDRSFLEVETPLLSSDTVIDRHLDPLAVFPVDLDLGARVDEPLWLQTSPEFAMKRLLAAGGTALFQVTRAFRGDEQGPIHNREFTIVEWYRVGDDLTAGMDLLDDFSQQLLQRGPASRLSYSDVFADRLGTDPLTSSPAELQSAARRHGLTGPVPWKDDDRDAWLDWLLASCIQPELGFDRPAIVFDYPASQAALATVRDGDPAVAERFELYANGMELANGYHELTDPVVLRRRNQLANAQRQSDGKPRLPEQSRLLDAMDAGLPASAGVALGFDRLVMAVTGAKTLSDVMAFPADRA